MKEEEIKKIQQFEKYENKNSRLESDKKIHEIQKALKKIGFPIDIFRNSHEKKYMLYLKKEIEEAKKEIEDEHEEIWRKKSEDNTEDDEEFKIINRTNSVPQVLNRLDKDPRIINRILKKLYREEVKKAFEFEENDSIKKIKIGLNSENSTIDDYIKIIDICKKNFDKEDIRVAIYPSIMSIHENILNKINSKTNSLSDIDQFEKKIQKNTELGRINLKKSKIELNEKEIYIGFYMWFEFFRKKIGTRIKNEIREEVRNLSTDEEEKFCRISTISEIMNLALIQVEAINIPSKLDEKKIALESELNNYKIKRLILEEEIEEILKETGMSEIIEKKEMIEKEECCSQILEILGVKEEDDYFYLDDLKLLLKITEIIDKPPTDALLRACYYTIKYFKKTKKINLLKRYFDDPNDFELFSKTSTGYEFAKEMWGREDIKILIIELLNKYYFGYHVDIKDELKIKKNTLKIKSLIYENSINFTSNFFPLKQLEQMQDLLIIVKELL